VWRIGISFVNRPRSGKEAIGQAPIFEPTFDRRALVVAELVFDA
jgi:hypothetical protein